jgi:hypothetical protein
MFFRGAAATIVIFSVFACSGPDEFLPQEPWRDSYPVHELWVAEDISEAVSVVNLDRWQTGIAPHTAQPFLAGSIPNYITVFEDKGYVVNSGANSITVFSLRNPEDSGKRYNVALGAGTSPWAAALVRQGSVLYALVTGYEDNTLSVVRIGETGGSLVRKISLANGTHPEGIVSTGDSVWIAMCGFDAPTWGYNDGYITQVDISSADVTVWQETESIAVAPNPQTLAWNDAQAEIFVLSTGNYVDTGKLAVYNAATREQKRDKALPSGMSALTLDKSNGRLYIGGGVILCLNAATLEEVAYQSFQQAADAIAPSYGWFPSLALDASAKFLFAAAPDYSLVNNRVFAFNLETDTQAGTFSFAGCPISIVCATITK